MLNIDAATMKVTMHKGDTGEAEYTIGGDTLASADRVLFTMKNKKGEVIKTGILTPSSGVVTVEFDNDETCDLPAGLYYYDLRVLSNPTISDGVITAVDAVDTPMMAAQFELLDVIGDVKPEAAIEEEEVDPPTVGA